MRRVGGRINTHTLKAGDQEPKVDLGATFVCGACFACWARCGRFAVLKCCQLPRFDLQCQEMMACATSLRHSFFMGPAPRDPF